MGRDKSLRGLYSDLGYSGSPSSSFANIINSLIKENIIVYRKNSNKTLLHLNDE